MFRYKLSDGYRDETFNQYIARIIIAWFIRAIILCVLIGLGVSLFYVWPQYRVWQRGLAGEASLRQAEQERKILVEQARAEKDSASLRAEAIEIVGKAAKDFPEYRKQEFMGAFAEALQNHSIQKIIFVPTEANIPITEAGRTAN